MRVCYATSTRAFSKPHMPTSLHTQLICDQRSETLFPISNGFMGKRKTSLQKHLCHIT